MLPAFGRPCLPVLLLAALALPVAAVEPIASGISLSYMHMTNGEVDLGRETLAWDHGQRFELQLRDYFLGQGSHYPFYELGFFVERHDGSSRDWEVASDTFAVKGAIGSATTFWTNDAVHLGVAPQVSLHLGRTTLDTGTDTAGISDSALRYGGSVSVCAWAAFSGGVSLGAGPFASYWRAGYLDVVDKDDTEHRVAPSGWDVGVRMQLGVLF
jgi:hypothetical protein